MNTRIILFIILSIFGSIFAQDESSLFNKPSKKELYSRAREVLKTSIESKDVEKARQALEYLQANTQNGAPLTRDEEYRIYFEIGDFEKGIILYEDLVHQALDSLYKPKNEERIQVDDVLSQHLATTWRSTGPENHKIKEDSLLNAVNNSDTPQQYKDLFTVLVYLDFINSLIEIKNGDFANPEDTILVQNFLDKSIEYCSKYPMTGPAVYLKEQTIPQIQQRMKEIEDYRRDPFIYKYYTGGLSIYGGKWIGFLSGEATDYLKDEMGTTFIMEAEIQIRRVALGVFLSWGLITRPKFEKRMWGTYEDESVGVTLGYVTYDSRFLKVTPFIGYSSTELMTADKSINPQLALGLNVDSHLLASKPSDIYGLSFCLNIRFKYMAQIGSLETSTTEKTFKGYNDYEEPIYDYKTKDVSASIINHTFALELGVLIW